MKKIIVMMITLASIFMFGSVEAKSLDAQAASYQAPVQVSVSSHTYYPTDIAITNLSSRFIDIYVPVLHFSGRLYPHYVQHVIAYDFDPKRVILYDYNGIIFMDRLVANHEAFNIYDRMGKTFIK